MKKYRTKPNMYYWYYLARLRKDGVLTLEARSKKVHKSSWQFIQISDKDGLNMLKRVMKDIEKAFHSRQTKPEVVANTPSSGLDEKEHSFIRDKTADTRKGKEVEE